jgi:hypothetical protein
MKRTLPLALLLGLGACIHSRNVARPPPSALAAVEVDSSGVPFAPAPEGLLRAHAIDAIQERLHAQGLISGAQRTGKLDATTREALRHFQSTNDLPSTGLPSYRTIEALKLPASKIFFSAKRPPRDDDDKSINPGSDATKTTP